jgi:hypothetical protein
MTARPRSRSASASRRAFATAVRWTSAQPADASSSADARESATASRDRLGVSKRAAVSLKPPSRPAAGSVNDR